MKLKLSPLVIALASLGVSSTVFASSNQAQLLAELKSVNKEMHQLQSQVSQLRSQVNALKAKSHARYQQVKSSRKVKVSSSQSLHFTPQASHPVYTTAKKINKTQPTKRRSWQPEYNLVGNAVLIAPFTGVPNYFNGSQLVVNSPSINEDLKLLMRRKLAQATLAREGQTMTYPHLVLSGALTGLATTQHTFSGANQSDLNLTQAELDMFADISPWVTGLISFTYQDSPADFSANRVDNSRVTLNKGFITIGNLNKSPIYGSIGQMYIPFGRYSSSMISDPLTTFIGKAKVRALNVAVHPVGKDSPYAEIFAFNGVSDNNIDQVRNFGVDAGYQFADGIVHGVAGASYVNNIANANGMQETGMSSGFEGFDQNKETEDLRHFVPGGDVHGHLGVGPVTFTAEYVTALRNFSKSDMTFDGKGARPSAFNTELNYGFHLFHLPSSVAVGYNISQESLALNIPRLRYDASFEIAILRDTILTFEYRHDINYGRSTTATGSGMTAFDPKELGHSSDAISAQLGVYF